MSKKHKEYTELPQQDKTYVNIVESIIANEIAVNKNQGIQDTLYYKFDIKRLLPQVQKHLYMAQDKEFDFILKADEQNTDGIQNTIAATVEELASIHMYCYSDITELLIAYKKSPESLMGIAKKVKNAN